VSQFLLRVGVSSFFPSSIASHSHLTTRNTCKNELEIGNWERKATTKNAKRKQSKMQRKKTAQKAAQ
jgi:hypothetical protein